MLGCPAEVNVPVPDQLTYPIAIDLVATFLFAWSGALLASRRGYDPIGVFIIALVSGVGGGLIRDGVFLQQGPPAALRDSRFLTAVLLGCVGGVVRPRSFRGASLLFETVDAVGLGLYAIVGASAAVSIGLEALPAVVVGVSNAVGGGILRDVLTREEPLLLKPGQFYAAAALAGCATYVGLWTQAEWPARHAGIVAVGVTLAPLNWCLAPIHSPPRVCI